MQWHTSNVLITGASSGIGEATARELAARGARLILVARRQAELERVARQLVADFPEAPAPIVLAADITRAADRDKIFQTVQAQCTHLDVLINNAGITAHGRFDESRPEVMRQACEINFFAAVELTGRLLTLLKAAKTGTFRSLVYVSTPSGLYGVPGRSAYSASKAAGHAWMESLRMELKEDNIDCVIFCPGYTRTALRTSGLAADGSRLSEEQSRHARTPEEMAVRLRKAIEGRKRTVLTGNQGRLLYYLRTLAPGLLEFFMRKKLREDMKKTL